MTFYRRHLPHWHPEGASIFLTWRLHGSLPVSVFNSIRAAKNGHATKISPGRQFKLMDNALDAPSCGPQWLKDPRVALHIVETFRKGASALNYFDLHAFVIMPNHVHLLITPKIPLSRITNGIKGSTAHFAKSLLQLSTMHFWQAESYDHWPRSSKEFDKIRAYIELNPVSAGLAPAPQAWPWSSCNEEFSEYLAISHTARPAAAPEAHAH